MATREVGKAGTEAPDETSQGNTPEAGAEPHEVSQVQAAHSQVDAPAASSGGNTRQDPTAVSSPPVKQEPRGEAQQGPAASLRHQRQPQALAQDTAPASLGGGAQGDAAPEPQDNTNVSGVDADTNMAPQEEAEAISSGRRTQEFAFRPTRPRSKANPRNLARGLSSTPTDPITPHAPTSGLDSLAAVAAAWELGDEEGAEHFAGRTSSQRDSEGGAGGYGGYGGDRGGGDYMDYDEEGADADQDYEDADADDDGDGDMSPYGRDGSERGGGERSGGRGSGGRRPCPRRGGAPRRRDLDAESRAAEEAGLQHAATSGRPELDQCSPEMFEADLVLFLTARKERQLAAHVREKRITCNSLPLDIYGLYREVVKRGGYIANERYDDKGSRWTGTINFAGDIFPRLRNWTANNRATSVGSQLLNNYRKFLLAYERAYLRWDLPHTEMAAQQRASASTAGNNPSAQAAAIVASSIGTANRNRAQPISDPTQDMLLNSISVLMHGNGSHPGGVGMRATDPPNRRSTAGGTSSAAGYKRGSREMSRGGVSEHGAPSSYADPMLIEEDATVLIKPTGGWVPGGTGGTQTDQDTETMTGGREGKRRRQMTGGGTSGTPGTGISGGEITPGSVVPLHLAPPPVSPSLGGQQPGVRRVQQLQQLWAQAQLSQVMSGQQCLLPGQLLLAQDPTHPTLQWAVLVADLGELPLEVVDGLRLPHTAMSQGQQTRLPLKLVEATPLGRLEDATPVLLLGSNAIGWVERTSCRPANPATMSTAMSGAWARLTHAGGPSAVGQAAEMELACVRGLKVAAELLGAPGAGGVGGQPAFKTYMQAAAMSHSARKLLDLEGALCTTCVSTSSLAYWHTWRKQVTQADSPASLSSLVLTLAHQILPTFLSLSMETVWPELLALVGLSPPVPMMPTTSGSTGGAAPPAAPLLVSGREGEPSCLGVDMAISLLQASVDWPAIRRVWSGQSIQAPGASTPTGGAAGWPLPGGPPSGSGAVQMPMGMTGQIAMPASATGSAITTINLVDRGAGGRGSSAGGAEVLGGAAGAAARRPLPPVGPTAPPPAAPVGASFSSRAGAAGAGGGGLPPRPPPVRVTGPGSLSGPSPPGGQQTMSPTSGQPLSSGGGLVPPTTNGLSPLRLVPTGPPGFSSSQILEFKSGMDLSSMGVVQMGTMGAGTQAATGTSTRGQTDLASGGRTNASTSRVGSPLAVDVSQFHSSGTTPLPSPAAAGVIPPGPMLVAPPASHTSGPGQMSPATLQLGIPALDLSAPPSASTTAPSSATPSAFPITPASATPSTAFPNTGMTFLSNPSGITVLSSPAGPAGGRATQLQILPYSSPAMSAGGASGSLHNQQQPIVAIAREPAGSTAGASTGVQAADTGPQIEARASVSGVPQSKQQQQQQQQQHQTDTQTAEAGGDQPTQSGQQQQQQQPLQMQVQSGQQQGSQSQGGGQGGQMHVLQLGSSGQVARMPVTSTTSVPSSR